MDKNTTEQTTKAVVYDLMIPHRENHLVLDTANSESETELQGNRQIIAPYRGAVSYVQFTTDQRKYGIYRHCVPMVRH